MTAAWMSHVAVMLCAHPDISAGFNSVHTLKRERERSNSTTIILEDSSVRSILTYLTASPCYTINAEKKNDSTTNRYYKQLMNAVEQSLYECAETSELRFTFCELWKRRDNPACNESGNVLKLDTVCTY